MILNPEKPAKMAKKPRKSKEERVGSVYHDENLPKRSYQTRTKNPDLPALQTRQPTQAKMEVDQVFIRVLRLSQEAASHSSQVIGCLHVLGLEQNNDR
jgi:hypothetical protein